MKRSFLLSLLIIGLVAAWMLSGQIDGEAKPAAGVNQTREAAEAPFKVLVVPLESGTVTRQVIVQGQLEPDRVLAMRAETSGQVLEIGVRKGERVTRGQLLISLAEDDRPARIAGARAELAQQQLQMEGARRLADRQLQSETQLKLAEAAVAAAQANLEVARLDLQRTRLVAPFDGVIEDVMVEQGSLLERGDEVLSLVDNQGMKAVGYVPQQSARKVRIGQKVAVRMLDGGKAGATVEFISRVANSQTRSFRVEARLDETDEEFSAGVSAEMVIATGESRAHFVSASALTLDSQGIVGIKAVGDDDTVSFHPVSLVRSQADGVWVSGLPDQVRIIVRGQSFVAEGQTVEPVVES